MSTPSTTTETLLFVTRRPAWEAGVKLRQTLPADIFTARSGLEQRESRQSRSRYAIQYSAFLSRAESIARQLRSVAEIKAPLIVPFWTETTATTTGISADVVTINRVPDADWFSAGDYVFFTGPLGDQFRLIESVAGSDLTLEADLDALAFPSGTTVYPCRACIRDASGAMFSAATDHTQEENLSYLTL